MERDPQIPNFPMGDDLQALKLEMKTVTSKHAAWRRTFAPARVVRDAGVDVLPRDDVMYPSRMLISRLARYCTFRVTHE